MLWAAVVVALVFVAAWEAFWRLHGFTPSLVDDAGLWAARREHLCDDGGRAVALLGSSRMQVAIDLAEVERRRGIRPLQLAIDGNSGVPVLEDIAAEPCFVGTAICDLNEDHLRSLVDRETSVASEWTRQYRERTLFSRFEWSVRQAVQQAFVFRLPELGLSSLATALRTRRLPVPSYTTITRERWRQADYSKVDIEAFRQHRESLVEDAYAAQAPLSAEAFRRALDRLDAIVDRIQSRGGRVVFVRLPTTGRHWELDASRYPKKDYWDVLASRVRARTIHFKDHASLASYRCPDSSHIDYRDATAFTADLLDIVGASAASAQMR